MATFNIRIMEPTFERIVSVNSIDQLRNLYRVPGARCRLDSASDQEFLDFLKVD
mgnify:FL=1